MWTRTIARIKSHEQRLNLALLRWVAHEVQRCTNRMRRRLLSSNPQARLLYLVRMSEENRGQLPSCERQLSRAAGIRERSAAASVAARTPGGWSFAAPQLRKEHA